MEHLGHVRGRQITFRRLRGHVPSIQDIPNFRKSYLSGLRVYGPVDTLGDSVDTGVMAGTWKPEDTPSARLLLVRRGLNYSVAQIAEAAEVRAGTWSSWEHGTTPSHWHIIAPAIAERLGVDPEWLEWGSDLLGRSTGCFEAVAA